jgi:hypothetical protein
MSKDVIDLLRYVALSDLALVPDDKKLQQQLLIMDSTEGNISRVYKLLGRSEHPVITSKVWSEAVAAGDTTTGYWDWVFHVLTTDFTHEEFIDRAMQARIELISKT